MRRPVLLIFSNAMILIVVFALLTQSLVLVQRIARASKISGQVEVQRSGRGEFKSLQQNGAIKTGDVVRTGHDGNAEFKWTDGTRWKVMSNTQIKVRKATYNMAKKADQRQLELTTGKVFIRIMRALTPSSKFEIETPTAVAAVRGTIFSVEVANGKTQVAVFKGKVKVSSADEHETDEAMIVPGQAVVSATSGTLQTINSDSFNTEFVQQTSIVKPEVDAKIKMLKEGGKAIINGTTEAGNTVTVNGVAVKALGNGSFFKRVTLQPGTNTFTIVSTDKHGETSTVVKTISNATPAAPSCPSKTMNNPAS